MTVTFMTFSFTFTIVVQFAILKACTFFYFFQKLYFLKKMKNIFFEKNEKYIFLKKLNETDASLSFLTVEQVAVSLPTKCLSNPTSCSVLIGDYRLSPAHFPG